MPEGRIENWPGYIHTLSGGTRTAVNLDRPWQKQIVINPDDCPFCAEEREGGDRSHILTVHRFLMHYGHWKVRRNQNTPFPFHRLILPLGCYDHESLQNLGGGGKIAGALQAAQATIKVHAAERENPEGNIFFFVHVGYSAGQRYGHLHWHFVEPLTTPYMGRSELLTLAQRTDLHILRASNFTAVAGGARAGQCYLLPDSEEILSAEQTERLAAIIRQILDLYNRKFLSSQNLPPDYSLILRFREGEFIYARYTPILNHWGATEYSAIDEGLPFVLPWPHEVTVKHLLG